MAYPVGDLDEYVRNMTILCDVDFSLTSLKVIIEAWRIANAVSLNVPVTQPTRNEMLKIQTGNVVALDIDLNCYPVGYNTQILFDLNGDPVI